MSDKEAIVGLSNKINVLVALSLIDKKDVFPSKNEKIIFLKKFDLSNQDIAEIVGTSVGTVKVAASVDKRKTKKK